MNEEQQSERPPSGVHGAELTDWATALALVFVAGMGVVVFVLLSRRKRKA